MFFTPRRKRAMLLAAMLLGLLYHFTVGLPSCLLLAFSFHVLFDDACFILLTTTFNPQTDSASSDLGSFYKSTTRAMNRGFHRGDGKLQEPEPEQKHLQPDSSPGVVRGGDRVHVHGMGEGQAQDAEFRKITLNEVGEQDRQAAHPDRELELHKERKAKEKANKEGKKGSSDGAAVDDSSGAKQPEPPVDEKEAKLRKQPGPGSGKTNGEPEKKTPERAVADELKDIFNRAPGMFISTSYPTKGAAVPVYSTMISAHRIPPHK